MGCLDGRDRYSHAGRYLAARPHHDPSALLMLDGRFYGMGVSRCLRVTKPRVPQPLCHNNFLAAHHLLSFSTVGFSSESPRFKSILHGSIRLNRVYYLKFRDESRIERNERVLWIFFWERRKENSIRKDLHFGCNDKRREERKERM